MKVFLHADDFGLTRNITDDILECIDAGVINSVSIMANGEAFEYGIAELMKRKHVHVSLHLNLTRGKPLSNLSEVFSLVDKTTGYFKCDFHDMFLALYFSNKAKVRLLKEHIRKEYIGQIEKIIPFVRSTGKPLKIDSERGMHLLPPILDLVLDLHGAFPIEMVRLSDDRLIFPILNNNKSGRYTLVNLIKFSVLYCINQLNRSTQKLQAKNIKYCDLYVGVQYSGRMSAEIIRAIINLNKDLEMELICHPGKALESELASFQYDQKFSNYLIEASHVFEKNELLKWAERNTNFNQV